MRAIHKWVITGFVVTLSILLAAITLGPIEVECPVCHTKNTFTTWMSYGSYVYSWPSKYQDVYWPATAGFSWYTCKHCYFSQFMGDFKDLPPGKVDDVRRALAGVTLDGKYEKYDEIPVSKRLEIAEKVYTVLDRDDHFWAWFYRVQGYHFAREKKSQDADAARAKSLECTRRLLNDSANAGQRKELLIDSAAMHHFLGDDVAAGNDLHEALKATFENPKWTAEKNKTANENLDHMLKDYIEQIEKKTVPKDDGSEDEQKTASRPVDE